jgi:outer membrane biosynthesis protein TonB
VAGTSQHDVRLRRARTILRRRRRRVTALATLMIVGSIVIGGALAAGAQSGEPPADETQQTEPPPENNPPPDTTPKNDPPPPPANTPPKQDTPPPPQGTPPPAGNQASVPTPDTAPAADYRLRFVECAYDSATDKTTCTWQLTDAAGNTSAPGGVNRVALQTCFGPNATALPADQDAF